MIKLSNEGARQEIKYKIFYKDISHLYFWLNKGFGFKRSFEDRKVNSLYFDTPQYTFAASNMSGESNRIKIRSRWYGKTNYNFIESFLHEEQKFNIEVKRKSNNFSDKLQLDSFTFRQKHNFNERVLAISSKVKKITCQHNELKDFSLNDSVFVNYDREYYVSNMFPSIRFTVDKNIVYSKSKPIYNPTTLSINYLIAELKFPTTLRDSANKLMENFPFRQVRSSKFLASLSQINRVSY